MICLCRILYYLLRTKNRKRGKQGMSEREQIKQIIDRLPEYKLAYIANLIFDIEKIDMEEVEPDEWDLEMIAEAKANNNGSVVFFEELLKTDGLTYADL